MGAPRGHVRALPPGLQRSTRGEDAAGPGWGPAWPGVRRNGGLRAAGGFGALKPGPARCLGRGPRGRLRLRDPQHVSQRTPLAYSLPAPRLGCGGRGVSGDPGILRGALGLGYAPGARRPTRVLRSVCWVKGEPCAHLPCWFWACAPAVPGQVAGEGATLISISCCFQTQTSPCNRDRLSSRSFSALLLLFCCLIPRCLR